ncbi:MAG: RHS repeat-associated core domain-containing protein [Terriglobia bacterium]
MVELQQPCLGEGHGGGVTYDHLFDPAGNWLGVAGSYSIIMQGGRPLVVYNSAETWFHHVNNIGSRTFMTNHYGTPTQDMLFYPYGNLWQSWGGGGLEFADLTYRDPNTTTDLTENRLFSPNLSRWHSPDPLGGDITNPQSLNRYAYVLNSPTTLIDPSGLEEQMVCANLGWSSAGGPNGLGGWGIVCASPEEVSQSNQQINQQPTVDWDWGASPDDFGGGGGGGGGSGGGNIIKWPQLQTLVHQNNLSNQCDGLIDCIIFNESHIGISKDPSGLNQGFYADAVSDSDARGLMQLTGNSLKDVLTNGLSYPVQTATVKQAWGQMFNPALNIEAGSAELQMKINRAHGDVSQGVTAYGPVSGSPDYASDIINCATKLASGDVPGAYVAATMHN